MHNVTSHKTSQSGEHRQRRGHRGGELIAGTGLAVRVRVSLCVSHLTCFWCFLFCACLLYTRFIQNPDFSLLKHI